MQHFPTFLPMHLWHELGDFLNGHEDLAAALGIMPNAAVGMITEVELRDVLCGELDIWPECLLPAYLAAEIANELEVASWL